MRCLPLILALAFGCAEPTVSDDTADPGPNDTDDILDTDEEEEEEEELEPCEVTVERVTPRNGGDAPVDTDVTLQFTGPVSASDPLSFSLHDPEGAIAGDLVLANDGLSAVFTPNSPLQAATVHQMEVEVCEFQASGSFTTLPPPISTQGIEGRTFGILYEDVQFIEPGLTDLLEVDFDYLLVQIDELDAAAETFESLATTGFSHPDGVDLTCPAARAPTSDLSINPAFTVGPTDLVYPIGSNQIILEGFTLNGRFSQDGESLLNVHLIGLVDPSTINSAITCTLASFLMQGTCQPCPSGVGDCLLIEAVAPQADWMPELDIVQTCGG